MMARHLLKIRLLPCVAALLLIASAHASVECGFDVQFRSLLQQDTSTIDSLLALRELSFDEVLEKYSFVPTDIEKDVAYEKLKPVTAIGNKTSSAPHFFFKKKKLVMIYLTAESLRQKNLKADDFIKRFGRQGIRLRSRAGKTHHMIVYPAQGVALSTDGTALDFLEVFPPTTADKYRQEIYREVGPFIK